MSSKKVKLTSSATMSSRKIKLISSDKLHFVVDKGFIEESETIRQMIEESETIRRTIEEEPVAEESITLPMVKDVIEESKTVKRKIEEEPVAEDSIPLPITGVVLRQVLRYLEKHSEARKSDKGGDVNENLKAWDDTFIEDNLASISNLTLAAYELKIKSLQDLTARTVLDIKKQIMDPFNEEWEWVYFQEEKKGGEGLSGEAGGGLG